ncbi:hypothetical protein O206_17640 [Ochrobactrum sp. EGD-AQ16]|nr:hypothetical protein O206_17640 [Ochrobactrum sp. EGD-AQ16]
MKIKRTETSENIEKLVENGRPHAADDRFKHPSH